MGLLELQMPRLLQALTLGRGEEQKEEKRWHY